MSFQVRLIAITLLILAIPAAYGTGVWKGKVLARAECETAALIAQIQETERQRRAAEAALRQLQELLDEQSREIQALTQEAEAYVAQLADGDQCQLDDADVKRLRAIR